MSRRFCVVLSVLLGAAGFLNAQNLVPNPSFEDYLVCPQIIGQIPLPNTAPLTVEEWCRPTNGSSDYFNSCGPAGNSAWVPTNFRGHQEARTGAAYAGMYTALYDYFNYSEYLQIQLQQALIAGHQYYVSYWVNLADNDVAKGHDQLGALFLNDYMSNPGTEGRILMAPQVASPTGLLYDDTSGWSRVYGSFTAAGGEAWMILGSFQEYENLNFSSTVQIWSYYYVDDVCVLDLNGDPLSSSYTDSTCVSFPMTLSGRAGSGKFLWHDGDTTQTKTVTENGVYWVKSIDLDNCAFSVDTFRLIEDLTEVGIDLGNDTFLCDNQVVTLRVSDPAFTEFLWSTGATTAEIVLDQAGTYYVTALGACAMGTDTIVIEQVPQPGVSLPQDTLLCNGDELWLQPLQGHQGTIRYSWNTGQDSCCIVATTPDLYILTAENICGDQQSDSVRLTFTECYHCLLAPTAFSPNGDGLNDAFTVLSSCVFTSYHFSVFNRWGERVFTSSDIQEAWDGTYKGQPCDVGVYYYYVHAQPVVEAVGEIKKTGEITLLR